MQRLLKLAAVCLVATCPMLAASRDYAQRRSRPQVVTYRGDAVLGQLVDGAGWRTTITLVNLDTQPASFTIFLFADNGASMTLPVVDESGQSSFGDTIEGTIPVGGSTVYATEGASAALAQGWAAVLSDQRIAGQGTFRRLMPGLPDTEAVVPLTSLFDLRQMLPFDNTGGFGMGIALANPGESDITVTLSFRDCDAAQVVQDTITLPAFAHTAFMLATKYPRTNNQRGVLEITTPGGTLGGVTGIGVAVLGLRGNPSGALTTVFTLVSPDWVTQR